MNLMYIRYDNFIDNINMVILLNMYWFLKGNI